MLLVSVLVPALVLAQAPPTVTVDGRLLTGANTSAEERGGRLFVPVVTIAEALGDNVRVRPAERVIEVRRGTGVIAEFNANLGQITENGVPTLLSTSAGDVVFPPNPQALMLPVEVASALLDSSIVVDANGSTVRVSRDLPQVMVGHGAERSFGQLYSVEYGYNLIASGNSYNQNLQATAAGRAWDGRFGLNSSFSGGNIGPFMEFRNGLATLERPNGQRFLLGDLGTGGDLTFMSTSLRGGWWRQPVAGMDVTTFAGMAFSDGQPTPETLDLPSHQRFDTPVVGSYFTLGRGNDGEGGPRILSSTGGMYFKGPDREGGLLSTGLQYQTQLHQFRADFGFGSFAGYKPDGTRVRGTGLMLETTESLTPVESLTLTAGFTHVGENYLGPQLSGFLRSMNQYSGGASWSPFTGISISSGARFVERLDRTDRAMDQDLSAALSMNLRNGWPTFLLSHSEGMQAEIGRRRYTLLNISRDWSSFDLFTNLSSSKTGDTPTTESITVGGGKRFRTTYFRGYQTLSTGAALSGGLDMYTSSFFTDRVSVNAGIGYSKQEAAWSPNARVGIGVDLPGKQLLRLTYTQTNFGGQAFLELRGPLFQAKGAERASTRSLESLQTLGSFTGRVYQDNDLDGRYNPGVDRALSGVEVRLDGNNSVRTDADGVYSLSSIPAGQHSLYLNLLTVRADLSMLTSPEQDVLLLPDRDVIVDFRLIRTGRASGQVWVDANSNGEFEENEETLGDVRVVTGNRDTLTNGFGEFILGDLPQGQHSILIDAKTLPEGYEPVNTGATLITITPPRETRDVKLPVRAKPVEVEIKQF